MGKFMVGIYGTEGPKIAAGYPFGRFNTLIDIGGGQGHMPRITFITAAGERAEVEAPSGLSVMEIARLHDLGIEGACEASVACATCHVIVDAAYADRLDAASAEEEDMLEFAVGVGPTSRLGCQIVLTEELDGLTVRLPDSG